MKKIAIATVFSALIASPAIAGDGYLGVNVGQNKIDVSSVKESTAFGILGGYAYNENLAAEVAYIDLGSAERNFSTSKLTGNVISIAAVGSLPLNNDFSVFAKLGYAQSKIEVPGISETKSDLTYGIGAQYNASKTVGIRLGYDSFKVGTTSTKDSALITIGAIFKL